MVRTPGVQENPQMSCIARSSRERITISTLYRVGIVFFIAQVSPRVARCARISPHAPARMRFLIRKHIY